MPPMAEPKPRAAKPDMIPGPDNPAVVPAADTKPVPTPKPTPVPTVPPAAPAAFSFASCVNFPPSGHLVQRQANSGIPRHRHSLRKQLGDHNRRSAENQQFSLSNRSFDDFKILLYSTVESVADW